MPITFFLSQKPPMPGFDGKEVEDLWDKVWIYIMQTYEEYKIKRTSCFHTYTRVLTKLVRGLQRQNALEHKPVKSTFKKGIYTAHFAKEICDSCPNFPNCPLKSQKKRYFFKVTETKLHRAKLIVEMKTNEYKKIASKRAGIEGISSVLRRRYNIDHLPVRGLVRSKIHLGFKISAINCKRLIKNRLDSRIKTLASSFQKHLSKIFCFQGMIAA